MSLQVWLPLNGDLHNQGLSKISVTNNGATITNNGKIGKCYYFDGTATNYINTTYSTAIGTSDFSIAMWIKIPTMTSGTYYAICTSKTTAAASAGFGIYWNYSQKKFLWSTADGSGSTEIWMAQAVDSIVYDKWIHLVMVRNSNDSKKGYFYINGQRYELASIPAIRNITTDTKLFIGRCTGGSYLAKMYLNDFRIYDHALSEKEIKRISKALTIHFKLDRFSHLASNIIRESSGFGNNGNGTLAQMTYPTDTPRYKNAIRKTTSYVFVRIGNSTSIIYNHGNNWMAQGSTEMTINLWAYSTNWTTNNDRLFSCTQNGGFAVYVSNGKLVFEIAKATNAAVTSFSYVVTSADTSIDLAQLQAGWHMFTFIYCSTGFILYLDGEFYSNYNFESPYGQFFKLSGSSLNLGAESASDTSATSPWFKGGESDFRLYYTALSADDVKKLYRTSKVVNGTTVTARDLE